MTFRIASHDARPGFGRGTPPRSLDAPRPEHARAGDGHRQGADAGERRRLGRRAARRRAAAGDDDRRRADPRRRRAAPLGPDALRPLGDDGLRHRGLHRLLHHPRLRRRQPLQLPPRRPADQRRDLDPAREQGARRHPEGPLAACRRERARRAAWSTSSSSARSTRRCARPSSSGASAAACSARSTSASASAQTTRSAFASTPAPSTSTRSCATRRATATCSRSPATGARARRRWSRPRSRTATDRSRAFPASACSATPCRRVPDPKLNLNNQPWSLPVVFDATTASLRVTQKLGEGWRLVAHGLDAAPAHRRPHRLPVRLHRPEPAARRHLLPRPLLPERQLRPLRLPQRQRVAPQQHARRHAARRRRARARSRTSSASACSERS